MQTAAAFTASAGPCGWEEDRSGTAPSQTAEQREAVVTQDTSALNKQRSQDAQRSHRGSHAGGNIMCELLAFWENSWVAWLRVSPRVFSGADEKWASHSDALIKQWDPRTPGTFMCETLKNRVMCGVLSQRGRESPLVGTEPF